MCGDVVLVPSRHPRRAGPLPAHRIDDAPWIAADGNEGCGRQTGHDPAGDPARRPAGGEGRRVLADRPGGPGGVAAAPAGREAPVTAPPADLAAAVARVGVDPTLPERQLEDALRSAIADRRGYLDCWYVDDTSLWKVELLSPVRETFGGRTLAQALGQCLVAAMGWPGEIGVGAFA
jgi:hypothetical protein